MYTLILIMITTIGIPDAITFKDATPFQTLEACKAFGKLQAEWLTQDFVKIEFYCVKQEEKK